MQCCEAQYRGNCSMSECGFKEYETYTHFSVNGTCTPPEAGWAQRGAPLSCFERNWLYLGLGAFFSVDLVIVP